MSMKLNGLNVLLVEKSHKLYIRFPSMIYSFSLLTLFISFLFSCVRCYERRFKDKLVLFHNGDFFMCILLICFLVGYVMITDIFFHLKLLLITDLYINGRRKG